MSVVHFSWATEEFGNADLGHLHRTKRLVAIAAHVAASPGGRITDVFRDGASREAAFRFVENDAVDPRALVATAARATVCRAKEYSYVYVPTDGTSLNIADWQQTKGTGVVGARRVGARGFQVMDSIAVAPDGAPLGLMHVEFWPRIHRTTRTGKHDTRKTEVKETRFWLKALDGIRRSFERDAPETTPWFQLDRGADAWPVLDACRTDGIRVTVRASWNRTLWRKADASQKYLREEICKSPVRGTKTVHVPARAGRPARDAQLSIRFLDVTLDLHNSKGKCRHPAQFSAVHVREQRPPAGAKRIEWLLLTTWPVEDLDDALAVIDGYTTRWTIEEFHKTWKSGSCAVETTQLRAADHIQRWAIILATVAARIQRLIKLSRTEPELPATVAFKPSEIKAILAINRRRKFPPGREPTLGEAVTRLAELGGYTGRSSGGPPGPIVLARALDRLQLLVDYFEAEDEK